MGGRIEGLGKLGEHKGKGGGGVEDWKERTGWIYLWEVSRAMNDGCIRVMDIPVWLFLFVFPRFIPLYLYIVLFLFFSLGFSSLALSNLHACYPTPGSQVPTDWD